MNPQHISISLVSYVHFTENKKKMLQRHVTKLDIGNADDLEELERAQAARRAQGRPPLGSTGPQGALFLDDSDMPPPRGSVTPNMVHRTRGTPPPDRWNE